MKQADLGASGVGVLIGSYAIWEAQRMPEDLIMKIGPGFFPTILASLLVLFSLVLMINALRGKSKGTAEAMRWADPGLRRGLIMVLATAMFCGVLKPLGFIPASIIFMIVMMWVFGNRRPRALVLAPLIVTGCVWLIFEKLLHLNLPQGVLTSILG